MKKYLIPCLAVIMAAGVVLADGAKPPEIMSEVAIDTLVTAVTDWAKLIVPFLLTIAGCFLGFYLLKFAIRAMKSVAGAAK